MVFSLALIPVLLITNEFASFVGITYQIVRSPLGPPVLAIGLDDNSQNIRTFLNSLGLVLLTIYQAATFFIVLLRLTKAVLAQRNIEMHVRQNEETHLFRGTGWIAIGVKLGFAETVVGFASGSFGLFFTRRLLRMLSRACLVIGVVRG
ncbi:hypothetical protein EWM64_g10917 [Hericium alpestre]|uniref:Uncharacterized protein n=1 Tax=Hericium alpestre TaxID=135208 RepID=A0A4Y9ZE90_9AGAM|nr:hypothetical protein EWM64_g10917 [Hericium alpestre]